MLAMYLEKHFPRGSAIKATHPITGDIQEATVLGLYADNTKEELDYGLRLTFNDNISYNINHADLYLKPEMQKVKVTRKEITEGDYDSITNGPIARAFNKSGFSNTEVYTSIIIASDQKFTVDQTFTADFHIQQWIRNFNNRKEVKPFTIHIDIYASHAYTKKENPKCKNAKNH